MDTSAAHAAEAPKPETKHLFHATIQNHTIQNRYHFKINTRHFQTEVGAKDVTDDSEHYTLHYHISFWYRDWQLFKCLHLPDSEEGGYREDPIPLYGMRVPACLV